MLNVMKLTAENVEQIQDVIARLNEQARSEASEGGALATEASALLAQLLQSAQEDVAAEHAEMDAERNAFNEKSNALEIEAIGLRAAHEAIEERAQAVELQLDQLRQELIEQVEAYGDLKATSDKAKMDLLEARAQLEQAGEAVDLVRSQMKAQVEALTEQLAEITAQVEDEVKALRGRVEDMQQQLVSAQTEAAKTSAQYQQAADALARIRELTSVLTAGA